MDEFDVLIVGGGVAGAACACAFAASNLRVGIIERRPLHNDSNRGDALHAAAVKLLDHWNAKPELDARGAFWVDGMALTTRGNRPTARFSLDESPMLMLAHAEIEVGLTAAAQAQGVELYTQAVREIEKAGFGWKLTTDTASFSTRLLIGADGERSVVRRAAGIPVEGEDYGVSTVVAHAPIPTWLEPTKGWALAHPDGGVLVLPTTPAGSCRVVAQVVDADLPRWREAADDELASLFGSRNPQLNNLPLKRRGAGGHIYKLRRQHANRYAGSSIALVGDAAHITHPNGGQGMTMAIRDADALSTLTLPILQGGRNGSRELDRALWEYSARRRPDNARAIARADRISKLQRDHRASYYAARAMIAAAAVVPSLAGKFFGGFGK